MEKISFWHWLVVLPVLAPIYLLPSIFAYSRKHPRLTAIIVANVLLGWTCIGWLATLVLAVVGKPKPQISFTEENQITQENLMANADNTSEVSQDPNNLQTVNYAGFWLRAGALVIDSIVSAIIFSPITILSAVDSFSRMDSQTQVVDPTYSGLQITLFILGIVLYWLYSAVCESSKWQATIGKKLLNIKVTDLEGHRISFARATGRHFSKAILNALCCIGVFTSAMAAFTLKKQALHDIIVGTLVVRSD